MLEIIEMNGMYCVIVAGWLVYSAFSYKEARSWVRNNPQFIRGD